MTRCLNVTSSVVGSITLISLVITLIAFGYAMDAANFPGANLLLKKTAGKFVNATDGYELDLTKNACSNYLSSAGTASSPLPFAGAAPLCDSNDAADFANNDWTKGWIVAPSCTRDPLDPASCTNGFSTGNLVALSGAVMFGSMALQAMIFGIVSVIELKAHSITSDRRCGCSAKIYQSLAVVWMIVAFSLFVVSGMTWLSFCDKLDAGLGRLSNDKSGAPVQTCGWTSCEYSFAEKLSVIAAALAFGRLPNIIAWADPDLEMSFDKN